MCCTNVFDVFLKAELHGVVFLVKVKIEDKVEYFSDTVTTAIS